MTCERCQLIEDEYVRVEAEQLTRDALMLAVAALRVEVSEHRATIADRDAMEGAILASGQKAGQA